MGDQAANAVVAVVLGVPFALLLLVPTAAYQYRLDGRLQPRDLLVLVTAAVYSLAIWTYTLLPLPVTGGYRCRGRQLDPFGSISDVWLGPHQVAAFAQVGLNVLLFVPLGWYLRVIVRRGVATAALAGLAVSLLVELTQTTGVWHLYDCAYRLFDVDDLLVNTVGAVVGSLLSYVFLDRRDETTPSLPDTVSLGRRVVSMVSGAIASSLLGATCLAVWLLVGGDDGTWPRVVLLVGVPFVAQAVSVLAAGRTVGDHVVAVRAVARRPGPPYAARLVRLLTGVTPAFALVTLGLVVSGWWVVIGLSLLAVVDVAVAARTDQHRGLSNALAGLDLRIAEEERVGPTKSQS